MAVFLRLRWPIYFDSGWSNSPGLNTDGASDLRERFRDEEPGTVGAIVSSREGDVSVVNLAAAIARDGRASEVAIVVPIADEGMRERARRAGIGTVVDLSRPLGMPVPVATRDVQPVQTNAPGSTTVIQRAPKADESSKDALSQSRAPLQKPLVQGMKAAIPVQAVPVEPIQPYERQGRAPIAPIDGGNATEDHPRVPTEQHTPSPRQVPNLTQNLDLARRQATGGPVLVFASGRGGVGKTTLSAVAAQTAGAWGMNVALVDLDLACGNLYSCFGVMRGADLTRISEGAVASPEVMGHACVRCSDHISLWGPCERPEMAELVMPRVGTLIDYLSRRFDLVVVDTSTTFTDAVAQAAQSCDRLLLVHDERAGAIASLSRMSALAVRLGVARTRIMRITNLCDPRVRPPVMEGRGEVGLETARIFRVADGGYEAEELLASGKVAELVSDDSELSASCASMLAQVLSELGKLPESTAAREALEIQDRRRRFPLFGRRKEAS